MSVTLDFYFDLMSPYAYLAHTQLPRLARRFNRTLVYHPVDLAALKRMAGNTGPSNREIPIKHRYLRKDLKRWADHYGVPFQPPAGYGSERVNRGVFYAAERGAAEDYVTWVWCRIWGAGHAMDDDALICDAARHFGWDEGDFASIVATDSSVSPLIESTREANRLGIFGVPMVRTDDELWWGNDRLHFLESHLATTVSL